MLKVEFFLLKFWSLWSAPNMCVCFPLTKLVWVLWNQLNISHELIFLNISRYPNSMNIKNFQSDRCHYEIYFTSFPFCVQDPILSKGSSINVEVITSSTFITVLRLSPSWDHRESTMFVGDLTQSLCLYILTVIMKQNKWQLNCVCGTTWAKPIMVCNTFKVMFWELPIVIPTVIQSTLNTGMSPQDSLCIYLKVRMQAQKRWTVPKERSTTHPDWAPGREHTPPLLCRESGGETRIRWTLRKMTQKGELPRKFFIALRDIFPSPCLPNISFPPILILKLVTTETSLQKGWKD